MSAPPWMVMLLLAAAMAPCVLVAWCPAADAAEVRLEEYGGGRIVDITHAYRLELPAAGPGGLGPVVRLKKSMENGSISNVSELRMVVHAGTHVDAPGHFVAGLDVDKLDLRRPQCIATVDMSGEAEAGFPKTGPNFGSQMYVFGQRLSTSRKKNSNGLKPGPGPALLVDVPRDTNITAEAMESLNIPGLVRVLFRTLNTDRKLMRNKAFDTSFVGFTEDGAQWLADNTDIKLVGVDYLSVAAFDHLISAHVVFFKNPDIIPIEGLKLDDVKAGIYMLHCLPLRLVGSEGSPIRCILIK